MKPTKKKSKKKKKLKTETTKKQEEITQIIIKTNFSLFITVYAALYSEGMRAVRDCGKEKMGIPDDE